MALQLWVLFVMDDRSPSRFLSKRCSGWEPVRARRRRLALHLWATRGTRSPPKGFQFPPRPLASSGKGNNCLHRRHHHHRRGINRRGENRNETRGRHQHPKNGTAFPAQVLGCRWRPTDIILHGTACEAQVLGGDVSCRQSTVVEGGGQSSQVFPSGRRN